MDEEIQTVGAIGYSNVNDILRFGEEKPLEDILALEALITMVKKYEDQLAFYKDFKKRKIAAIDQEMDKVASRVNLLKSVAQKTLEANKEKSVSFPGTGRISTRKKAGGWEVKDEDTLHAWLEKELDENEYTAVVEKVPKIKKKELNKMLDLLDKSGKQADGVERKPEDVSVSISFDKEIDVTDVPELPLSSQPVQRQTFNIEDLDFRAT